MKLRLTSLHLFSALTLCGAVAMGQARPAQLPAVPPPVPSNPSTPTSPPAPSAPTTVEPRNPLTTSDLKIILMDGSVVSGKLSVSELAVDTKFGTLKVPVDQILSLAPGLQSHPKFTQALEGYINDLAADGFAEREKAQAALVKLGPEIKTELERHAKASSQGEKHLRLQKIVEDFEAQLADDEGAKIRQWSANDVVVTPGFTVVGRIVTPGFAVTSPYGTLQLKFEDIREARRDDQAPEDINKNVTIAGTNISQKTVVNSNIRLNKGDQVFITASGSITLTPWGQATTPEGNTDVGNMGVGGFPIGTLYARIGDSGPYIKVGNKTTFTANTAGVLNLGISTPNSNYGSTQFPGEFQAKVRVVKKQ